MLRLKALEDRQVLIEEIFDELDALLSKKEGNAIEEEDEMDELSRRVLQEVMEISVLHSNPADMTDEKRAEYYAKLLDELKKKKELLEQSLLKLDKLVAMNSV